MTQVSLFTEGHDSVRDALLAYRIWLQLHPKDKAGAKNLAGYHLETDEDYRKFEEAIK